VKVRPSEYLKRIWYDCITYHPAALRLLIEIVGADRVLFGTDYPHQVHDMKGSMAMTGALPAEQCYAIREGNARAIFRL
jgi:aminocarboxymuconate-semialdehyde decarboxylase